MVGLAQLTKKEKKKKKGGYIKQALVPPGLIPRIPGLGQGGYSRDTHPLEQFRRWIIPDLPAEHEFGRGMDPLVIPDIPVRTTERIIDDVPDPVIDEPWKTPVTIFDIPDIPPPPDEDPPLIPIPPIFDQPDIPWGGWPEGLDPPPPIPKIWEDDWRAPPQCTAVEKLLGLAICGSGSAKGTSILSKRGIPQRRTNKLRSNKKSSRSSMRGYYSSPLYYRRRRYSWP